MINTTVYIILYLCVHTTTFLKVWKGFVFIHKKINFKVWIYFIYEVFLPRAALQLFFFCLHLFKVPLPFAFLAPHPTILWTPLWMDEMFVNVSVVSSIGVHCETSEAKKLCYNLFEYIIIEKPRLIRVKEALKSYRTSSSSPFLSRIVFPQVVWVDNLSQNLDRLLR